MKGKISPTPKSDYRKWIAWLRSLPLHSLSSRDEVCRAWIKNGSPKANTRALRNFFWDNGFLLGFDGAIKISDDIVERLAEKQPPITHSGSLSKRELMATLLMAGYNSNPNFGGRDREDKAGWSVRDADALLIALTPPVHNKKKKRKS